MNARWVLVVAAALAACDSSPGEPGGRGRLQVNVFGLPNDVAGAIVVRGPRGFSTTVTKSTVLSGLVTGEYQLASATVRTDSTTWSVADSLASVTVTGDAPVVATVNYALTTGRIAVIVGGLPGGATAPVTVTGPGGFSTAVGGTRTLNNLVPGTYEVSTGTVNVGNDFYSTPTGRITVFVGASIQPSIVQLTFQIASGTIDVLVNGLPSEVAAKARLTGPQGLSRDITASGQIRGLLGGLYTIAADSVASGAARWAPLPPSQTVNLATGATASLAVSYVASGSGSSGANLTVAGVHFQQVVQTFGGAVPLVAGRDALLRIFIVASDTGVAAPEVRVQLYQGSSVVSTTVLPAPAAAAPTSVDEGTLSASWNLRVAAALVVPGLGVRVDVDPANRIAETSETDNAWPPGSAAQPVQVRTVDPIAIRFIPVLQSATGLAGRVASDNIAQFLDGVNKLLPATSSTAAIAPPYTTSAPAFVANDSNNAWPQVLAEINALRTAEGGTEIYYGVVQTPYVSGIAGLAYINGRAAIGWDRFPGATLVVPHELGHSYGRFHSPCGTANVIDAAYPYAGGVIGVYGYSAASNTLVPPTAADIMGYCTNAWISDYTFTGMLNYRVAHPAARLAPDGAPEAGLLVWGRIEHGQPVLEPAFDVVAPPALPRGEGTQRLELRGESGEALTTLAFDATRVADAADTSAAHFAFVVPRRALGGRRVASVRFTANGRAATLTSPGPPAAASARVGASRPGRDAVRLSWRDPRIRGAMVRDPATGRILAFVRGGSALVRTRETRLELTVSDGVRSTRQVLDIPRQ